MTGFTVKVEGLAEVTRRLELLPDRVGRNALKRALRRGANVIRDLAKGNARAFDDPETTESIAKNIVTQSGSRRRERQEGGIVMRVGVLGGAKAKKGGGTFAVGGSKSNPGGDTFYFRFLEFGTSQMAARPFLRPAMNSGAPKAFDTTASAMVVELDKGLRKLP